MSRGRVMASQSPDVQDDSYGDQSVFDFKVHNRVFEILTTLVNWFPGSRDKDPGRRTFLSDCVCHKSFVTSPIFHHKKKIEFAIFNGLPTSYIGVILIIY